MVRRLDEPGDGSADWSPRVSLDRDTPSTARMYDFYLGGKDNFEADRLAAEQVAALAPTLPLAARANRAFMHRTVEWCAREGIDQIIDVGTGMPTSPNAYEVARKVLPEAVVIGVDHDNEVLAHDRARLDGMPIVFGDIREIDKLIADLDGVVDWDRRVAVLLIAVLHFVTDEQDPVGVVSAFTERMVPGSLVVISHGCSTGADPDAVAGVERVYDSATSPGVFRTHGEIAGLFGRLRLVEPGLVPVQRWRPDGVSAETAIPMLGGVGRVPEFGERWGLGGW